MSDSQMTRSSLLVRIQDGQNVEAWSEFVEIYSPVVFGNPCRMNYWSGNVHHAPALAVDGKQCDDYRQRAKRAETSEVCKTVGQSPIPDNSSLKPPV